MHATAVVLGVKGVLIRGASGSGKSSLALELIRRTQASGTFAALVGDDQISLEAAAGRLVANAPRQIFGLIEVHGLGPTPISALPAAAIDLSVHLCADEFAPRYQEPMSFSGGGVDVPELTLRQCHTMQSAAVIFAHLARDPFAGMRQNG